MSSKYHNPSHPWKLISIGFGIVIVLGLVALISIITLNMLDNTETNKKESYPLPEVNLPIEEEKVIAFMENAMMQASTFNFDDLENELENVSSNFTPEGWKVFYSDLENSGTIKKITEKEYIIKVAPSGPPIIALEGLNEGRYTWKILYPTTITYTYQYAKVTQNLLVNVIVVRTKAQHSKGLVIDYIFI